VLLGSAALCVLTGLALVYAPAGSGPGPDRTLAWPRGVLWGVSLQTWLQGLLAALLPAALLSLSGARGASLAEVGAVSLGLQVYQLFAVLATYAAPVLYDRLAGGASAADGLRWLPAAWRRRGAWLLAWAVAAALALPAVMAATWPAAAAHQAGITAMALAGLAALMVRVGWTLMQAQGRIRALTWQAGWRLVISLAVLGLAQGPLGAALAVPLALLVVELLSLAQVWRVLGAPA